MHRQSCSLAAGCCPLCMLTQVGRSVPEPPRFFRWSMAQSYSWTDLCGRGSRHDVPAAMCCISGDLFCRNKVTSCDQLRTCAEGAGHFRPHSTKVPFDTCPRTNYSHCGHGMPSASPFQSCKRPRVLQILRAPRSALQSCPAACVSLSRDVNANFKLRPELHWCGGISPVKKGFYYSLN